MARNVHGRNKVKAWGFRCGACSDKGYTWIHPKTGLVTPCDCAAGRQISEQLELAQKNVQICRKISRDGFLTKV